MPSTTGVASALHARFAQVFERINANSLAHEKERTLPYEEVRELAAAGFGSLRLPVEEGGAGVSLAELFALLVELGAADSNQPQIWRNHVAFVEDRCQPNPAQQNRHWRGLIAGGAIVGGAWVERDTAVGEFKTVLSDGPTGPVLNGTKYYSTGSILADWVSVRAKRGTQELIAMANVAAPGLELLDDWTGFGQRTSGSGTTVLRDVVVSEEAIFAFDSRSPYQAAVYQLVHVATLAGIARGAHRDLVGAVRRRSRAYPHGLTEQPRDDAQVQAVVGRIGALASAAVASVVAAAERLDVAASLSIGGEADPELVSEACHEAAVAVYEAQVTVSDDTLAATTLLFDALSASGLDASGQLDRHWRNARTIASHNPTIYKERILGAWYLNGEPVTALGAVPSKHPVQGTERVGVQDGSAVAESTER
jgi:alkylation response protein AidB-like acyl-CoA dehydrogenase